MKIMDTLKMVRAGIDFAAASSRHDPGGGLSATFTPSTLPEHYPEGLTTMWVSGNDGWPAHGNLLSMTYQDITTQIFISKAGSWLRIRGTTLDGNNQPVFTEWRQVDPTGWTNVTTWYNGWKERAISGFLTPGYKKDLQGVVRLRGLIDGGTLNTRAFILPVGYRPPHTLILPMYSDSMMGQVRIAENGDVIPYTPTNPGGASSLDGVPSFHVSD